MTQNSPIYDAIIVGSRFILIAIEDYVYLVPFVESEEAVFLKTIIPSRKATKSYLGEET